MRRKRSSRGQGWSPPGGWELLEPRRLYAAGGIDTAFGVHGIASLEFQRATFPALSGSYTPQPVNLDVSSLGTFLLAAADYSQVGLHATLLAKCNNPGQPDPTFGENGRVVATGKLIPEAVFPQSDGKIVVGGHVDDFFQNESYELLRFRANGSVDHAFGPNGDGTLILTPISGYRMHVLGATVRSDGTILALEVGSTQLSETLLAVERFQPDGTPDESFGAGGAVVDLKYSNRPFSAPDHFAFGSDGSIVLTGDGYIRRFGPDGTVDKHFTHAIPGRVSPGENFGDARVGAIAGVAVDAQGLPIVARVGGRPDKPNVRLQSYRPSGARRSVFAKFPITSRMTANYEVEAIETGPSGDVWVTGLFGYQPDIASNNINEQDFPVEYLVHFRANGKLDTSFADRGMMPCIGGLLAVDSTDHPIVLTNNDNGEDLLIGRYTLQQPLEDPVTNPLQAHITHIGLPMLIHGGEDLTNPALIEVQVTPPRDFAGDATVHLFLSRDATSDDADAVTASVTQKVRARAGRALTLRVPISEIATIARGHYWLVAEVSMDGQTSHTVAGPLFWIGSRRVNLYVNDGTRSAATPAVNVTVGNAGNVRVARSDTTVMLFGEPSGGGQRFLIQTLPLPLDLAPEETLHVTLSTAGVSRPADSYGLTIVLAGAADDFSGDDYLDTVPWANP